MSDDEPNVNIDGPGNIPIDGYVPVVLEELEGDVTCDKLIEAYEKLVAAQERFIDHLLEENDRLRQQPVIIGCGRIKTVEKP